MNPIYSLKLLFNALIYPFRVIFISCFQKDCNRHSKFFAKQFQKKFNSIGAYTFSSGRGGIFALLSSMKIGKGDEVLVTGYTCSAVAEPLMFLGIKPIYVDIDLKNFSMKPSDARKLISKKTKAMIIQHTYGKAAHIEELLNIAEEFDLKVIEDCALALGSEHKNQLLGTFGDASIFSFEVSKTISVGWGGMVIVNRDKELNEIVRSFVLKQESLSMIDSSRRLLQAGLSGILYLPQIYRVGGFIASLLFRLGIFKKSSINFNRNKIPEDYLKNPPDIQWSILGDMFVKLDFINQKQKENSSIYEQTKLLSNMHKNISKSNDTALIRYPLLVKNTKILIDLFKKNGIEIGQWFNHPISSSDDCHFYEYSQGSCKTAEFAANHIINLPTHQRLTQKDLSLICELLEHFMQKYPEEEEFVKENYYN